MACSNNVVRAGLTPKLRDVDTLCACLTYRHWEVADLLVKPQVRGSGGVSYVPPINEFVINRITSSPHPHPHPPLTLHPETTPSILLVTRGAAETSTGETLREGSVVLLAAGTGVAA